MAKDKSFAAKTAKAASERETKNCPQCGEAYATVKLISSVKSETKNSWKFLQNFTLVCSCNQKEIYI